MSLSLRPYQNDMSVALDVAWAEGHRTLCMVLPTGGGKTHVFGHKLRQEPGVTFAIAHRQELIFQISMALARSGVVHSIQAPDKIVKWAVRMHLQEFGRHYYDPQAKCILAGVRTLRNRQRSLSNAIKQAKLWVIDEGHHVVRKNEWGKAVAMFPDSCRGLGVTATPLRADGKGLGRHADGVYDKLMVGPGMRELINMGYLSDYRIFAPETYIDLSNVPLSRTGDFSQPKLVASVRKSKIIGDVVGQYLKITPGKIGVTFIPDVQTGSDITESFNAAGVPAAMVHAKTPYKKRQESVAALRRGDLKEIVNVDIFGEGFDLPAIEVCSMARPTCSYGLYVQQFGRDLRILPGKEFGVIIDHVGNVMRHGLPDSPREWSLNAREKRAGNGTTEGLIPIRTCTKCTAVYESFRRECPFCGHTDTPEARGSIEQVEGDLLELDPAELSRMRGEVARIDAPEGAVGDRLRHAGAPVMAVAGAMKQHRLRQETQGELREAIALWAGYQRAAGVPDDISYKRFFRTFGTDILSAQALGRRDAEGLRERIEGVLV